jgi:hypothetical protein
MKGLMVGVWCCVILTLTGCAVSREAVRSAYESAQVCCDNLALLRYEKLPSEGLKLFDIDEHSQMFAFDTGRSFLLGIELPPLQPPFVVRIKSFALGDHLKESQIFYPVVLVLDGNHRTLSQQLPPPNMSLSGAGFRETAAENRWGLGLKYQWDLLVDDKAARYLVIYTDARMLASGAGESRRVPIFVPFILPGFVTILPTGQQETVIVPYSAFGRISVQAQPEPSMPGSSVKR